MKVILLAPLPPPFGGIAGWTLRMMNADLQNWEVRVVDEKVIGGREVFGDKSNRRLLIELKRSVNIWRNLNKELKDPEVKVVHSCIPSATLSMMREYVCALITKKKRRKFILHLRCTVPNTTKTKIGKYILERICAKADAIIALNSQSYSYLKSITKTPIKIIPNFIEVKEIHENRKIMDEVKRVLYVGGVIAEKGCVDILNVAKEFPNIQFRMVGKIDNEISKIAKEYKNVVLTGPKDKEGVQEELDKADIFIFLSYFSGEGFSNALAEAMAAGLPCLVSEWAANKDMVEDNGGFVVPIKSPEMAIIALQKMLPISIRKNQSENNINKVKNQYSDTVVLSQYVELYENI